MNYNDKSGNIVMILLKIKVGIGRSRNSKVSSLVKVLQRDGLKSFHQSNFTYDLRTA